MVDKPVTWKGKKYKLYGPGGGGYLFSWSDLEKAKSRYTKYRKSKK